MRHVRPAALGLVAAASIAASGCGSSKSTTQAAKPIAASGQTGHTSQASAGASSKPLTRTELIAKGDAICYRLNTRRHSTKVARPEDYERELPALAAYEMKGANEMSELVPPASMRHDWEQMITGSHTIAEVTGRFRHASEIQSDKIGLRYDGLIQHAINQIVDTAKRIGFKECSRFL